MNQSISKSSLGMNSTYSASSFNKSNLIFKKDLENLQKEVEFIKKNIISIEDTFIESEEVYEKTFEEIFYNLNIMKDKIFQKKFSSPENCSLNLIQLDMNIIKSLIKEGQIYNNEVNSCNIHLIKFSL
jgi:glutathionyl-hydroquinone reductase